MCIERTEEQQPTNGRRRHQASMFRQAAVVATFSCRNYLGILDLLDAGSLLLIVLLFARVMIIL